MEVPPQLTRETGPNLREKCHAPYDCVNFFNTAGNTLGWFGWGPLSLFGDEGDAYAVRRRYVTSRFTPFLTQVAPECYAAPVQLPLRKGSRRGFGAPSENSLSHRTKNFRAVNATETRITGAVGMRHQTENVSGAIRNTSNVFDRPVWVRFRAR